MPSHYGGKMNKPMNKPMMKPKKDLSVRQKALMKATKNVWLS